MRIAVIVAAFFVAFSGGAHAAERNVVFLAHSSSNEHAENPAAAMAWAFKSTLETLSGNAFTVEVFPAAQVGRDDQAVSLVRKGVIQAAISSLNGVAAAYPLVGVLNFPFAFRDIDETYAVFDGPFGRKLAEDIKRSAGVRVAGFGDQGGFFVLTNSQRPIREPKDLAGLRIRVAETGVQDAFVKSLGAVPVGIAWRDIYGALKSGVVDGQMNSLSMVHFAELDNVQKYLTLTNHFFKPSFLTVNPAFYAALTAREKDWFDAAAAAGVRASRTVAHGTAASGQGLGRLRADIQVYSPSLREMAAFRQAAQPPAAHYISEHFGREGDALLADFLAAIETARGRTPVRRRASNLVRPSARSRVAEREISN